MESINFKIKGFLEKSLKSDPNKKLKIHFLKFIKNFETFDLKSQSIYGILLFQLKKLSGPSFSKNVQNCGALYLYQFEFQLPSPLSE